ncbi:MAG: glycosyltransferase family 4 protein [Bacteroidota bacterium]|nr:glycosyltransferase family 4 protein [Bacteroidota bacterium]
MAKFRSHIQVLMTTDTVGGVWSYSIDLCKSLKDHAFFHLITTGARMKDWQRKEAEQLENVEVFETDYMLEWMDNPWSNIDESCDWLERLEASIKPDVVHLNAFCYGSLNFKAPSIVVGHSDVYSWWKEVLKEDPPKEYQEYYWRVKKGLDAADIVIAPSQTMLNYLRKIYNVQTPAKVIYNAADEAKFYPSSKKPSVFSMGRIWDAAKNIQLVVNAAPQINAPVLLAGEQKNNAALQTNTENIMYLGSLSSEEIAEHLSTTAIYCLPAKYEPFGLSVLEAALSGCALVLGNIDSLKEIWGNNARYVDTEDSKALADIINELIQNKDLLNEYAKKAFVHAQAFSLNTMAQNYLQLYQQLQQKTLKNKTSVA